MRVPRVRIRLWLLMLTVAVVAGLFAFGRRPHPVSGFMEEDSIAMVGWSDGSFTRKPGPIPAGVTTAARSPACGGRTSPPAPFSACAEGLMVDDGERHSDMKESEVPLIVDANIPALDDAGTCYG